MSYQESVKRFLSVLVKALLTLFVFSLSIVLIYKFVNPPVTPLMVVRAFEQMGDDSREVRIRHDWVDYEEIPKSMIRAVISSEDQRFTEHSGFDLKAIDKAMKFNKKYKGRKVRGASTISQQTAKNVFLWPARSWLRKALEVYFTLLIELFWSKERIMEVYLNVIEFGDGLYGIDAASNHYYKKGGSAMNRDQSAMLAACIPAPLSWSPVKPNKRVLRRKAFILRYMGKMQIPE
jgi:monofunctional biosynthetic peptidoglycan transglycosylase